MQVGEPSSTPIICGGYNGSLKNDSKLCLLNKWKVLFLMPYLKYTCFCSFKDIFGSYNQQYFSNNFYLNVFITLFLMDKTEGYYNR